MANRNSPHALALPHSTPARPAYRKGTILMAEDLLSEQVHRRQLKQRHNRHLHGSGIVCGLWVVPLDDPRRPWTVQICPGYAIDCCGDEILLAEPMLVDVREYLWRQPLTSDRPFRRACVGIRYAEREKRPVAAHQPGCGCEDTAYEYSRIEDTARVDVLWTSPVGVQPGRFDFCAGDLAPCPKCNDSRHLILACLTLPASEADPIKAKHIDHGSGRLLLPSTTALQDQTEDCCCGESEPPPLQTELEVRKSGSIAQRAGSLFEVVYVIEVTNKGTAPVHDIAIQDEVTVSSGFLFDPFGFEASHGGKWIDPQLPAPAPSASFAAVIPLLPPETATLSFGVQVRIAQDAILENNATVSGPTIAPVQAEATPIALQLS